MKKIPTLFERDTRFKVTSTLKPECAWVLAGEGLATEKLDGTNVRLTLRAGRLVRVEKRRNPSAQQKAQGLTDGWYVEATPGAPEDKWIFAAVEGTDLAGWPDGEHACEALGPHIQGNPLGLARHLCHPFDLRPPVIADAPRTFEALRAFLLSFESRVAPGHLAEGLVFHHPDGRRAKLKRKDF